MKKYLIALLVIACNIGNQGEVFANTSNDGNIKKVSGVYVLGYERDMSDNELGLLEGRKVNDYHR